MSSNITATLGGRGLNSVVIRSTPDALSLRGELGSSTVPHKRLVGMTPAGETFVNGVPTASNNTVLSSDTAFVIEAVAGTLNQHQVYTLNTNYPKTLVTADTHKVVTTVIGNISEQDDFMGYTGTDSAGLIEASVVNNTAAPTTLSDIVVIRRTPNPGAFGGTASTLITAKILVRLVKRNYVTNTSAAP